MRMRTTSVLVSLMPTHKMSNVLSGIQQKKYNLYFSATSLTLFNTYSITR